MGDQGKSVWYRVYCRIYDLLKYQHRVKRFPKLLTSRALSPPDVFSNSFDCAMLLRLEIWARMPSSYCWSDNELTGGGCCGKVRSFGSISSMFSMYCLQPMESLRVSGLECWSYRIDEAPVSCKLAPVGSRVMRLRSGGWYAGICVCLRS